MIRYFIGFNLGFIVGCVFTNMLRSYYDKKWRDNGAADSKD